jgi:Na+/melibiose symporter-like transporter
VSFPGVTRPPVPAPAAQNHPRAAARPSWFHAAALATWNFLVTTASFVLFAGAWFIAVAGLQESNLEQLYAATAGTILLTPFALHRLMGRRGSLRFAIFASILASFATVYLLTQSRDERVELVLAALFMAQLVAVVLAEILTRRRDADELEEELLRIPGGIS